MKLDEKSNDAAAVGRRASQHAQAGTSWSGGAGIFGVAITSTEELATGIQFVVDG
jgi:hypothetical protein